MERPRILRGYLLRGFVPVLAVAIAFFVLILELVDLFSNLWRYLALEVPLSGVVRVTALYAPTCLSFALPVALLFAVAYSLGSLYASNELIAVFGSGISLIRFVSPLLILAALLSVFSFFFDDRVALPSYREKARLSRELLGQNLSLSNADVAVISREGKIVYRVDFYDDASRSLSGLTVLERDERGRPVARTEANSARWTEGKWILSRVRRLERSADGDWKQTNFGTYSNPLYDEPPEAFRSQGKDARELSTKQLTEQVTFLKRAGLPYGASLAERDKRYAFAFTPLVVVLLSAAIGGRFKKNVLLMSLLTSLIVATGYYVLQMVTMLMAKTGVLPPAVGAWSPLFIYTFVAASFFRRART